jgi:hypothetical protein
VLRLLRTQPALGAAVPALAGGGGPPSPGPAAAAAAAAAPAPAAPDGSPAHEAAAALLDAGAGGWLRRVTLAWQRGRLTNFDYLMYLNLAAGRTFNDLAQWPVFPWVLADYTSGALDLARPSSFRDLSKPMGAQTPARLQEFRRRYKDMASLPPEMEVGTPFMYGTHYSTPGCVRGGAGGGRAWGQRGAPRRAHEGQGRPAPPPCPLGLGAERGLARSPAWQVPKPWPQPRSTHALGAGAPRAPPASYVMYWLVRAAPGHMLRLQAGRFDAPDRLFGGVGEAWNSATTGPSDVKELIPEFFMPGAQGGLHASRGALGQLIPGVSTPGGRLRASRGLGELAPEFLMPGGCHRALFQQAGPPSASPAPHRLRLACESAGPRAGRAPERARRR